MNEYQIRIERNKATPSSFKASLTSDWAAIRRAQTFASDEDSIEVWKAGYCIYQRSAPIQGRDVA